MTETKPTEPEKRMTETVDHAPVHLNDKLIRMIGIPTFGIMIPNATGLLDSLSLQSPVYWMSYIFFIAISGMIWQGNRYLLFRTRKRFTWLDKPMEKLVLLVFNNVFYTAPVTVAMLCLWYSWSGVAKINWDTIQIITLINIICVLFVTHVYETVFMVKEQHNEQLRNAKLEQAKAEAELTALKNQVDPHFMFNSLNTLTYLIQNHPSKALLFTENLAEIYRYILMQKERPLVLLEDELEFTDRYTGLLDLRFGKALIIQKKFNGASGKEYLIPPTSVFMAFENAVKHNEISQPFPIEVELSIADGFLAVRNTIRKKRNVAMSSRVGLQNLNERFTRLTGKGIVLEKNEQSFCVKMPMVGISQ